MIGVASVSPPVLTSLTFHLVGSLQTCTALPTKVGAARPSMIKICSHRQLLNTTLPHQSPLSRPSRTDTPAAAVLLSVGWHSERFVAGIIDILKHPECVLSPVTYYASLPLHTKSFGSCLQFRAAYIPAAVHIRLRRCHVPARRLASRPITRGLSRHLL
ncbi:hypothetical protein EDB85DRAFT_509122 [Lactarius pseudohatsudake]|nr:hypothetical protein EDB85DRAFT_509122 [Lactarius pseudohatsudake]